MASQKTSLTIVYSAVYSGANQRTHQSSASLAFVRGIHQGPVNSPQKGPVTRKMFLFDGVFMKGYPGACRLRCTRCTFMRDITTTTHQYISERCLHLRLVKLVILKFECTQYATHSVRNKTAVISDGTMTVSKWYTKWKTNLFVQPPAYGT